MKTSERLKGWWRKKWALIRIRAHQKRAREQRLIQDRERSRRDLFLALAGAGLLSAGGGGLTAAQADTLFTAFTFAASGAPTARTMPDRLSDIYNVKDYGAKGDGTTNDAPSIQACVNASSLSSGVLARIFFPKPTSFYKVTTTIILPPQLFSGGSGCFVIEGSSPKSTAVIGSVNGFIFDTNPSGNIAFQSDGGYAIRNIGVQNQNTTAFTTGGIRVGGALGVTIDNVDITGCMVGITNEIVPGQRTSNNALSITNVFSTGRQQNNSIGIVASGDGIFLSNINLSSWDYCVCVNGDSLFMGGCHFESNRTCVIALGRGGSSSGASPVPTVPVICSDAVFSAVTFEGNGTAVKGFISISACTFINVSGQVHDIASWQGAGVAAQYGFDFTNGISNCVFTNCHMSGQGAHANFVAAQANPIYGGSPGNKFTNCTMANITGSPSWDIPTSGTGRAAYVFDNCNFNPYFLTSMLPWDTLTGATLSGTTLTFTSGSGLTGTRGLAPNSGALLSGVGVVANTTIIANGSAVFGATFDNGSGAAGNTMTIYGASTGVAIAIGAVLPNGTLIAYGPNLQNMVISGTALTFDVASFTGTMAGTNVLTVASASGAILQPGMRLYPVGTFGTDCYLMSQTDATHWVTNKTLTFSGVACQAEADLRAGYTLDLSTTSGYTACAIATRVGIGSYTVNNSQTAQPPISGAIWAYFLPQTLTLTSGSGNVWTFTINGGGTLNVGITGIGNGVPGSGGVLAVPFNNTYQVSQTYGSPVGPENMTVFCDIEGSGYNVSDSATAFSMGAVMSLAGGGSTRCRVRRNDTQGGYIIVG